MATQNRRSLGEKQESQTPEGTERATSRAVYNPEVDIIDGRDALSLIADLPGADESNAEVTLDRNLLTIRASVAPPALEGYTPIYAEYGVGDFERAFTISEEIDRDGIQASVRDGVLRVRLPKSKRAGTQKIAVKAG